MGKKKVEPKLSELLTEVQKEKVVEFTQSLLDNQGVSDVPEVKMLVEPQAEKRKPLVVMITYRQPTVTAVNEWEDASVQVAQTKTQVVGFLVKKEGGCYQVAKQRTGARFNHIHNIPEESTIQRKVLMWEE